MGIDAIYQAVPAAFPAPLPFTGDLGDDIVTVRVALLHGGRHHGPPPSASTARIHAEVVRPLLAAHPGIAARTFVDPGRQWDALHWLLSPARRGARHHGRSPAEDLGSAFVCGAHPIEGASATQGTPLRMTPASLVATVADHAATVREEELREVLAREPFAGVYKTPDGGALPDDAWRALMDYVAQLLALHRAASERGEALLVMFD